MVCCKDIVQRNILMAKRFKWAIVFVIVLVIITSFLLMIPQRYYDEEILMEMVIWPGGGIVEDSSVYYFIVKNDGTFISYSGLSRMSSDQMAIPRFMVYFRGFDFIMPVRSRIELFNLTRSDQRYDFIMLVQEREEITLSEKDFQHISELVSAIVSGDYEPRAWTNSRAMFLHNGKIYEGSTVWSAPLSNLISLFRELTPLIDF